MFKFRKKSNTLFLMACSGGSEGGDNKPTAPVTTLLTESQLNEPTKECYRTMESYSSNVVAVNNNGVVAGSIQSNPSIGCMQQGYLWNNSKNKFSVIPPLSFEDFKVTGVRLAALSSNLISGGITFTANGYEFATINTHLIPNNLINNWNYVYGISEQGQYITGTTLFGSYLFFDTNSNEQIKLTYKGIPLESNKFPMLLSNSSNIGTAVGTLIDENDLSVGIVCEVTNKICTSIIADSYANFNTYIEAISSDGKIIYGFARNGSQVTEVFSVNPTTKVATPLFKSYYIANNIVTDNGIVIVTNNNTYKTYLYDPAVKGLYSVKDLADKLKLPSNLNLSLAYLSPNGNYLAFDVLNFNNNIFGAKIYFPLGIADYLKNNLSVTNLSKI